MRVLQLGKYFPPAKGGIETVTWEMAQGLAARGVASDVLCFAPGGPGSIEDHDGYRVYRAATPLVAMSTPLSWRAVALLARLAPNYDVIHAHCPNPMAFLALWLVRPRAALVLQWHSDVIRQKAAAALFRPLERWTIRRAARVVGATPAHLECSPHRDLFAGKGCLVPFCIDPEPFRTQNADPSALAELRARHPGKKAVFALGRLIYYKGFTHLVDAAALLPDDWVVLIGGQGPDRETLAERIRAKGLAGKVELVGAISQQALGAYYAFCRVFCLPSTHRSEMFGMVQLEAMAAGRPIVSTNIPGSGVVHVNRHGETGVVVPSGDPGALARAILAIDADETRYRAMSRACLEVFAQSYTRDVVMEGMLACYEAALATHQP